MRENKIFIDGQEISANHPPYIVAEISANHNGSIERAMETIRAAKDSGVNAVKIQTYTPDTMTIDVQSEEFLIRDGLWKGRSLYELYGEAYTPFEWHPTLFKFARRIGITIFSSPFDETAVDLLESLGVPAYKIASFEIVDLPLIRYVAKTKKPILMSTGMASISEISEAIEVARSNGCESLALLHCISSYPSPISVANISAVEKLKERFDLEVGLSDHTIGNVAGVVATSLGASIIEKHFTLSRADGGVDSSFSLEPGEMKTLVDQTKDAYASIGKSNSMRALVEEENRIFRRSLYFVKEINKGEIISPMHVRRIRPGFGLEARYYDDVIGSVSLRNAQKGDKVTFSHYKRLESK